MKLKSVFLVLLLILTCHSEAQLRCFNLFSSFENSTPQYYAEVIDSLNTKYNEFIFNKNLVSSLTPDLESKTFSQQTKARYQAFRLRWILKSLKSSATWDRYDFDNLAKKLEQLTFLTDSSVLENMTTSDKTMYLQARRSLLSKGLESFLFVNSSIPLSMKRKVFNMVMTPFKDIYMRWSFAMFAMPKLNGAILSADLAAKIAWEGLDKNRDLLKPYLLRSQFKSYFNVFSSTYNWSLVAALFIGLPTYSYLTYTQIQEQGSAQVQVLFAPMLDNAKKMATTDYHALADEKTLTYFIEEFKNQQGRDPNPAELALFKKIKGL